MLAVIETHPIQYHAPVYRAVQARGVPVTAIYASDFSTRPYRDAEFGAEVGWDSDLLDGYSYRFLSRSTDGREVRPDSASSRGLARELRRVGHSATLILGYSPAFHRRAWAAAWRSGRPVLFRGETTDLPRSGHRLMTAAKRVALGLAYRSCARVLYIGTRSRRHFEQAGVAPGRLVFSPYCVDTRAFTLDEAARDRVRQVGRARLGIAPDDIVLAFVGKASARKGVDLIVGAIRKLPDGIRMRVVLVLAGDGDLAESVSAAASQSPAVAIRRLGVLPQSALSEVYHMADLLLLPSRVAETWGLVVNEALHHGVPCVVSDQVGCAPDLITRETGVVMAGYDDTALADAVVGGLRLSGRPEIREACRARVAGFSVDRAADGIVDAYRAVVPGTGTS